MYEEDELTFTDTSVALRMMRSQFPRIDQVRFNLLLKSIRHSLSLSKFESRSHLIQLLRLRCRHSYYSRNCTVASTIEPKSIENLRYCVLLSLSQILVSHFYLPPIFLVLLVQRLRRDKVVRVFKLNTGQDDHAIIFLDDYLNQVLSRVFYF